MATFTNNVKPTPTTAQTLEIGEGFSLYIGDGYNLLIQAATDGTSWGNNSKTTASWSNDTK